MGTSGNGRTAEGKFAPGNPGGPGRPRRTTEREYLLTITEACPPETWREIVLAAVEDARNGDAKAREWLAGYLVGTPICRADTLRGILIEELSGIDSLASAAEDRKSSEALSELLRMKV